MSREIKFRAWDKFDGLMRDTAWLEEHDFAVGVDGRIVVRSGNELVLRDHNMFPMQFTGLHDKNGKEIYEGDILSGNTLVVFDDGMFIPFYNFGREERLEDVGSRWWVTREVIGNIYENSDLLK